MADNAPPAQAEPGRFRAILTPHRSLAPRGFLILMLAIGLVSFVAGVAFLLLGAWPVFGFFGLDAVLIYLAFKLNYRAGRAYETIELTPACFLLTRVHASGRTEQFACNPYWARVRLQEWPDGRAALSVVDRGMKLALGSFLNHDEKRDLAAALKAALLEARGGARI